MNKNKKTVIAVLAAVIAAVTGAVCWKKHRDNKEMEELG